MSLIGNLKKVQSQVPERPRTRKVAKKKEFRSQGVPGVQERSLLNSSNSLNS
jgi:hypothetical protein